MSKKLVQYNPTTHEPKTLAIISFKGGKVTFEPADAAKRHNMLKSLVVGRKLVTPQDGKEYYDALDRLRGTYYEVLENK